MDHSTATPRHAGCDYCGLPVGGRRNNDGPCYCCSGCRLAASITAAGGATGEARWMMTRLGLAAFFSMNVMVFTFLLWSQEADALGGEAAEAFYALARHACLLFSAPVLLLLGGPLLENAAAELRRGRLTIDVLLVAGVAAAFGISAWNTWTGAGHVYYEVACMVLLAVTLGRWLEASGKLQTTAALRDLESLLPERVRRLRQGGAGEDTDVPLGSVLIGDMLRILPGEHVPTDAVIERGTAAIDEQTVSGESEPVVRGPGEAIKSGTTNLDGELVVVVTAPHGGGTLEQLIRAVTSAVQDSTSHRFADRVASWFLPLVLTVAACTCGLHWWRGGAAAGVMAALAVVVVSCPCALGLATPLALWAALGRCMRRHVLVREGDALERLASVAGFCLDKTGTLTSGCRVERMEVAEGLGRETPLAAAAGLARGSTHATATAITRTLAQAGIDAATIGDPRSLAGLGVEGTLTATGEVARLGSPRWINQAGVRNLVLPQADSGKNLQPRCVLAIGREVVAAFWCAEELRPTAAAAVAGLVQRGKQVRILSGDQPPRVAMVADSLGVAWQASLVPAEKLAVIERLAGSGGVAMVGDGINDAAALAAADVGIALGCGADISRWTAAVCLLDDNLGSLPWLVDLAASTRRTIRWNLLWAFGYNAACIPLAATGLVHPAIAAVAMVASSLLVVGNSLRLGQEPQPPKSTTALVTSPDSCDAASSANGTSSTQLIRRLSSAR